MSQETKQKKSKEKLSKKEKQLLERVDILESENKELSWELIKIKEVAAHSQAQYITLKQDFDAYQSRNEKDKKDNEIRQFIESLNMILPFVEELRKSTENLPKELKDNEWAKWVIMQYRWIINKLKEKWVLEIESIGKEPDHEYHEPIGIETSEKKMKGKIVREYEKWFIYNQWDREMLIKAAKVIVWN